MEQAELISTLRRLFPVFTQHELLREIIDKSRWLEVASGELIVDVGHTVRVVPLVLEGSIKVIREDDAGNEIFLYYIRAGESCAMTLTSYLRGEASGVRAIVESPARLLALSADALYELSFKYAGWNDFITETYARRFEEILEVIDQIAFQKMDVRLLRYLMDKSHLLGTRHLEVSRTQIARDLNSSREVISRLLKQMEKRQMIRIRGNEVELLDGYGLS